MTNPRGMNTDSEISKIHVSFRDACAIYIVANRSGTYGTLPDFVPLSRKGPGCPGSLFFFNKHLSVRSHPSMMNISFAFAVFPARLYRIKQ